MGTWICNIRKTQQVLKTAALCNFGGYWSFGGSFSKAVVTVTGLDLGLLSGGLFCGFFFFLFGSVFFKKA